MSFRQPNWEQDVRQIFAAPFWIAEDRRSRVGDEWRQCMQPYFVDLGEITSVRTYSETIYYHLASRSMPLTTDTTQFWPPEALETLRLWINQGWRADGSSPFDAAERIPAPEAPVEPERLRRDIRSLSSVEIDAFRAKLDDILRVGDPSPESPWQKIAYIHSDWCLHYQEAFAFWHRAFLLYVESRIDMAVPYWDWMAEEASVDGSEQAGLPQAFLDATYVHPSTGECRPNPLRYAAAKDGCSKLCAVGGTSGPECRFVQRDHLLHLGRRPPRRAREAVRHGRPFPGTSCRGPDARDLQHAAGISRLPLGQPAGLRIPGHPVGCSDDMRSPIPEHPVTLADRR